MYNVPKQHNAKSVSSLALKGDPGHSVAGIGQVLWVPRTGNPPGGVIYINRLILTYQKLI